MKRRIHFSLLLSAMTGLVALGAGGPQGHTGGGGLTVPEAWRGTWEVTVAYRDQATGALIATDVSTAAICPGEPIIPPLLKASLRCMEEAGVSEIGVLCRRTKFSPRPGCNVFIETELDNSREGDIWSGTGRWAVKVVGNCEAFTHTEDIIVSGTRVSPVAACDAAPPSLVHSFFAHGALVPFLEGGKLP